MPFTSILQPQDAQIFITGVFSYYLFIYTLHMFMGYAYRDFYGSLRKQLGTRKTLGLLVFIIGVLITLVSAPFCGRAFASSSSSRDGYSTSPFTLDSKICLGSRAVLWTAELPLLGDTHFYLVHHVLSLVSSSIVVFKNLNLAPIYLIYAGLITEVFSSSRAFIRGTGLHRSHPKLFTRITCANAISIFLFRTLPAIYILQNQLFRPMMMNNLGLAYFVTVAFYASFVSYIAYKLLAGLGYISFQPARPAHFSLAVGENTRHISVYSVMLGAAIATTQLSVATLYELARSETLPAKEISTMAKIGLGTVLSGLFGAKFLNGVLSVSAMRDEKPQELAPSTSPSASPSLPGRFFPAFKGISIQGAIFFSLLWLNFCPSFGLKVNNQLILGAAGVSLPFGEAMGRIGCYFAGCCGSTRREKYPGLQLLAAAINSIVFSTQIMHLANHGTSTMAEAGTTAVLANGVARLMLNPLRSDAADRLFSPASMFALAQVLLAASLLVLEKAGAGLDPFASFLATVGVAASNMFMCRVATFVWAFAAVQLQKWKLSRFARLENFVYAFSVAVFLLVSNSSAGDGVARAGRLFLQKEPLFVMSNPAMLVSLCISVALPMILLN
ncbi:hypothetical protein NLG97_g9351 [Lecanicillium saksenae]|uniref:Uncharacterized protein n=1 Tax=Lecanicillium saksenae TaxID=468837 RepID=A0ACC1QGG6_9HYPO|nr:hypothetical protein NLG97_g9351 [Lecanicillium saksenae]